MIAALLRRGRARRRPVAEALLLVLVAGLAASISLSQITLVVLAAWLLATRLGGGAPVRWPLLGPVAAFAGWTVLSAAASGAPADSLLAAKGLLSFATLWVVLEAVPDAGRARAFVLALLAALAVVSLVAGLQVATCGGERLDRVDPSLPPLVRSVFGKCRRAHGFFSIYMTLGGVLAVVLAATLPLLVGVRHRVLAAAGWLTATLALALTAVRGAWIGLAAGGALALTLRRRQTAAMLAVLVLASAVLAVPGVRQRLQSIGDPADATTRERLAMLDTGRRLVAEHPVLGVGPGQVRRLYPAYAPPEAGRRHTSHLHNTPLQIAVERGLVGLALWLSIFATFFVRAGRILRRLPPAAAPERALVVGCLAAVATFLVAGLFEYNFGDTEVLLVMLSVMALPFVVERDRPTCP